jgi:hypothetical protein
MTDVIEFPPPRAIQAEGARIGITECPLCGAAILLDPFGQGSLAIHQEWHRQLASREQCDD